MARRVFYSFHYKPDCQRAAQVRSIGAIEGNAPASDNDWERITRGGDAAIQRWIAAQLNGKSCAVVLVGTNTAGRKWISYEIAEAWKQGKGVLGIHVNKLKSLLGQTSTKGGNPLDHVTYKGRRLSQIAKVYTPGGVTSKEAYAWITRNIAAAIDEAIRIRAAN